MLTLLHPQATPAPTTYMQVATAQKPRINTAELDFVKARNPRAFLLRAPLTAVYSRLWNMVAENPSLIEEVEAVEGWVKAQRPEEAVLVVSHCQTA